MWQRHFISNTYNVSFSCRMAWNLDEQLINHLITPYCYQISICTKFEMLRLRHNSVHYIWLKATVVDKNWKIDVQFPDSSGLRQKYARNGMAWVCDNVLADVQICYGLSATQRMVCGVQGWICSWARIEKRSSSNWPHDIEGSNKTHRSRFMAQPGRSPCIFVRWSWVYENCGRRGTFRDLNDLEQDLRTLHTTPGKPDLSVKNYPSIIREQETNGINDTLEGSLGTNIIRTGPGRNDAEFDEWHDPPANRCPGLSQSHNRITLVHYKNMKGVLTQDTKSA